MRLARNVAHRICEVLPQRIAFLPIVEIGYCALGRRDAVEAGRELPAHPRMPSLPAPSAHQGSAWRRLSRRGVPRRDSNGAASRLALSIP